MINTIYVITNHIDITYTMYLETEKKIIIHDTAECQNKENRDNNSTNSYDEQIFNNFQKTSG